MRGSINPPHIGTAASAANVPAVILAGGRASRMGGGDKPLLRLGGRTVLDHVLAGLRPQSGPVAINANGPAGRFAAWDLPVLPDPWPDQPGPLAGVLASLLWAAPLATRVLTWPGDTPDPPPDLIARLLAAGAGVVCAASGGRRHPTVALWPVALAPALRATLARGAFRVAAFADRAGCRIVEWDDPTTFRNLNTPADLARADLAYDRRPG